MRPINGYHGNNSMSYTVEYYQSLVTNEHQSSPKYMAWLGAMIEPITVIQSVIENFVPNFDVDTAVGFH